MRTFSQFVTFLQLPFRDFTRLMAYLVLVIETVLAIGFAAAAGGLVGALPSGIGTCAFLIVASAFIAYRTAHTESSACACFGVRADPDPLTWDGRRGEKQGAARILLPVWYAARNGCLFLAAAALVGKHPGGLDLLVAIALLLVCPLVIMAGVIASIAFNYQQLSLSEHPLVVHYATRLEPILALGWYSHPAKTFLVDAHPNGARKG